ncbi:hypothetical protein ROZALSC1DRAFT_26032, partial [Rozella allomycis CSF55]
VLPNLETSMDPLQLSSMLISKSKSEINIPLGNDVLFENQAVLTNLENFMDPLQHPLHSKESLSILSQYKLISTMNLPAKDCSQTSSEANDDQSQNQSIHKHLNNPMVHRQQHPFISLSKSEIKMDLPSEDDVLFQNQPVLSNLETFMDPLQLPSKSISKSKSEINIPLENDVLFQNQPVLTNLENFMVPLQYRFQPKETPLNLSQSKLLSKMNLPVVDCSQLSSE